MAVVSPLVTAYLERIGLADPGPPNLECLRRLHIAHVAAIPFENLDILLGRHIRLEHDRLFDKLVVRRRGGYCFEQNTLFLSILREFGFTAFAMEARVLVDATAIRPRTHMVLGVEIESKEWLADVGFGGEGPIEAVPMPDSSQAGASGLAYRVVERAGVRVMQRRYRGQWLDQYAFLPQPVHPIDFEVANWYTSTHPESRFVLTLTAQRTTPDVRYVLRYPSYTEIRGDDSRTRAITRAELMPMLREVFLIDLPDDTIFPVIDGEHEKTED